MALKTDIEIMAAADWEGLSIGEVIEFADAARRAKADPDEPVAMTTRFINAEDGTPQPRLMGLRVRVENSTGERL